MHILKNKRHLYLVAIIACALLGLIICYMGSMASSSPVILVGFIFLVGGVVMFIMRRGIETERYAQDTEGNKTQKRKVTLPNCLVVRPGRITFEHIESPPSSLEQKCLNNNKYYKVLKQDLIGELEEFKLPDDDENERYYDPSEFANPVTMPSNKRYFSWSFSTMQKISVGIMLLVIIGQLVGLVALS